jgi:drug/metabolite transporter (DMT)-like permease
MPTQLSSRTRLPAEVAANVPLSGPGRPGLIDYALLVGLGAIWGASFMLIKIGVESIASWTLTAIRLSIAAAFMVGWAALKHEAFPRTVGFWWLAFVTALFGNVLPFILITWGQEQIDSGIAAICVATMPLMTLFIAHFALPDDRLTAPKLIGVSCGLAGLIILVGPAKLLQPGSDTVRLLAVTAAALCYATNAVATRKLLRAEPRYALAAAVMLVAVVITVPLALWIDKPWRLFSLSDGGLPSGSSLTAVIVLGIVQTSIAQIMLFKLIARQGASFFSQVNYFVPVFGVLWGWVALSEQLPAQALMALAVILSGLAIVRVWGEGAAPPAAKPNLVTVINPKTANRKKRRKQKHFHGR